jgi:hypothetical protein
MELFAVFETWHLGDGNYPPLEAGELVNLSFEIEPNELQLAATAATAEFHRLEEARYRFRGSVIRNYEGDDLGDRIVDPGDQIVVVEAGQFRFYICSAKADGLRTGDHVTGCGKLLLDHFVWVEFLSRYTDPPDLFYTLRVENIWRHRTPEPLISRSAGSVGCPARVEPREHAPSDVTKVDAVSDEQFVYHVIQFSDRDIPAEPVRRTFFS